MRNKTRFVKAGMSLMLTVALCFGGLAGCQNAEKIPEENTDGVENQETQPSDTGEDQAANGEEPGEGAGEMAEIVVSYPTFGNANGAAEVEAAINEITEQEINTHVTFNLTDMANYMQQVPLALTGGEDLDLFVTLPAQAVSFSTLSGQGYMMDMTELLDTYGTDIKSNLGDLLNGTTVNNEVLGVCGARSLAVSWYIAMRTDILEQLGLLEKAQNMTTYTELEEIWQEVADKTELAPIGCDTGDGRIIASRDGIFVGPEFSKGYTYDSLGETSKIVMCMDGKVSNYFANEDYKASLDMGRSWYEKGYVSKDSAMTEESTASLVKNNVIFSYFVGTEVGASATVSADCGMDMTCVKVLDGPPITTTSLTRFTWCIPNSSKEPEAAMKFLNLMYSNPAICNLLCWGIEGRDYVEKDGIAVYPDGVDGSSVEYHQSDFLFGNQFLVLPWDGSPSDLRQQAKAELEAAGTSEYLGFTCDTNGITNELAAVSNTINEYRKGLESGASGDAEYEEFLKKLEDSGIQKIIDEYQKQLDEWLAAN